MATEPGIIGCFSVLRQAGCRVPSAMESPAGLAQTARVWAQVLPDVSDDELGALTLAWLRGPEAQWWPMPGQLLELRRRALAPVADDADTAWGLLVAAIGRHGRYAPPTPSGHAGGRGSWWLHLEPRTCAALDAGLRALGGWWDACSIDPHDAAARASFRAAYTAALRSGDGGPERLAIGASNRPALTDGGGR